MGYEFGDICILYFTMTYCNVNTCRLPFFLSSSKITRSHDLKSRRIPVDVHPRKVTWEAKKYPLGNEKHLVACQFSGCELTSQLSFRMWILKVVSAVLFSAWPFRATWAMEGIL